MKITRFILFSDGLKWLLMQTNRMLRIAWRMLFSILSGFKGLRVDSLMINDSFLLSNGLIEIKWKVRYAWMVRINGKQLDPVKGYYTLYPAGEETVLDVHIRGLFRSYREQFVICIAGNIDSDAFPLPLLKGPLITEAMVSRNVGAITPSLPSFIVDIQGLYAITEMKVADFQIILPPLQTLTNHDQRLLHNT